MPKRICRTRGSRRTTARQPQINRRSGEADGRERQVELKGARKYQTTRVRRPARRPAGESEGAPSGVHSSLRAPNSNYQPQSTKCMMSFTSVFSKQVTGWASGAVGVQRCCRLQELGSRSGRTNGPGTTYYVIQLSTQKSNKPW